MNVWKTIPVRPDDKISLRKIAEEIGGISIAKLLPILARGWEHLTPEQKFKSIVNGTKAPARLKS